MADKCLCCGSADDVQNGYCGDCHERCMCGAFKGLDEAEETARLLRNVRPPPPVFGIPVALAPGARLPEYKTAGAAGMDLCALEYCGLAAEGPGRRKLIDTGVSLAIPAGYEGQVRPRSGLNLRGVICLLGTIDSDYRGSIKVVLINLSGNEFCVEAGDRVAQLVVAAVSRATLVPTAKLDDTARGAGGFGSTGMR